jgi:hypothetical protein
LRRDDPLAQEESIPQELIADRLRIGLARVHPARRSPDPLPTPNRRAGTASPLC